MRRLLLCLVIGAILLAATESAGEEAEVPALQKPADMGYEEVRRADAPYDSLCVFGLTGCEEDDAWLYTGASVAYGPLSDYVADVSPAGLLESVQRLKMHVRASSALDAGPNGPRLRRSLLNELGTIEARLDPSDTTAVGAIVLGFTPRPNYDFPVYTGKIFFEGPPNQIVLYEGLEPDDDDTPQLWVYYATVDQAIEVRTVCTIVRNIFKKVRQKPLERVAAHLAQIDRGWTNYLENGYSQYPWESLLNGTVTRKLFGGYSWYEPPNEQLVLLHPELCTLVDIRTRREASVQAALLVHGLGYIRYFGSERNWFMGLSASGCFSDERFGLAYGPTLHLDHVKLGSQLPHISVSVLWFDSEDERDGPLVAVAVDFWRVLNKEGGKEFFLSAIE